MTDAELRAIVRDAVGRHFAGGSAGSLPPPELRTSKFELQTPAIARHAPSAPHASHAMYVTLVNVGDGCLIEPAVTCNHCGYCKSHGH